jgi:hypothetical protein
MKIKKGLLGYWGLYQQLNEDNHVWGLAKWGKYAVYCCDLLVVALIIMILWV